MSSIITTTPWCHKSSIPSNINNFDVPTIVCNLEKLIHSRILNFYKFKSKPKLVDCKTSQDMLVDCKTSQDMLVDLKTSQDMLADCKTSQDM